MEKVTQKNETAAFEPLNKQWEKKERMKHTFASSIGSEEVTRRESNVKHFNLGGNRYQAIVYPEDVHYYNPETGRWEDIDNSLEETTNEHGRNVLRNKAGDMRVEFPTCADGGNMISIRSEGREFSWGFENTVNAVSAQVKSGAQMKKERLAHEAQKLPRYVGRTLYSLETADLSSEMENEQQRRATLNHLKAENVYENVLPGISVRYHLNGSTVKEDIILENCDAISNAAIRLPNNYLYEATQEGALLVKTLDTGECAFTMDPPVVYDAKNACIKAGIRLTPCNGYTRLEYVIDPVFLDNANYPVTIDPVTHSSKSKNTIEDIILTKNSSSNSNISEYLRVGKDDGNTYVSMIRFNGLPVLTASDTVVLASMQLRQYSSTSSRYVSVHEVLENWDNNTTNWTNFNPDDPMKISTDALDCQAGSNSSWSTMNFDITNLYRKWCNSNSSNYGVALRTPKDVPDTDNYTILYASEKNGSDYRPVLYINYVSHAGLEGWWQYEQMSAGRAGTLYADLFNGNVVLEHNDTVMTGNRMPVSVSHYYNSCLSNTDDFHCGNGWKTSAHQQVSTLKLNDLDYYVWLDGDGTKHYFFKNGSQPYEDSEGMELKLRYNSTEKKYTIEDKSHNKMEFQGTTSELANLKCITDAHGNKAEFIYAYDKLTTIKDAAGRETQFIYDSDTGKLYKITIPDIDVAGEEKRWEVSFSYDDNGNLEDINYSDLKDQISAEYHTHYTYEEGSNLLTQICNYDGMQVNIEYESKGTYNSEVFADDIVDQMRRVVSLEFLNAKEGTIARGAKQLFNYKHMCTEVTAVKNTSGNVGKKIYYQFNDSGNVVCVRDEMGYAYFTKFESNIENRPSEQSPLRKAVVNLLHSPDFASGWTTETSNVTKDTSVRCMGAPSVKAVGGESMVCYRQQIELEADKEYVLSAYVKTENVAGDGAYISLVSVQDGKTIKSVALKGTTPAASENGMPTDGWERVHANLDLKEITGNYSYRVELCLKGAGTAWFSCPQLEAGSIVSPVNLVSNGDFRYDMESWAAGSNNLGEATDGVFPASNDPEFPSALSGKYIQLEGRPNKSYVLYNQVMDLQGNKEDCFVTGGWANAKSIPDAVTASRGFGFAIRLKKSDDSWTNYKVMAFNEEWVGWQFGCWAYAAECDYKSLELALIYTHNCNLAKFSNIFLHREQFGQSYAYDEDKNIVSTGTLSGQKSDIKYDDADNIEKYAQPGRDASKDENQYIFKYYDSKNNVADAEERKKHLVHQSRTPMKVTDCFTYDAYGNQLSSRRVDNSVANGDLTSKPFIYTQTEYDDSGNYAIKTIDARGEVVEKEVDANTGLLLSVKDPNDQLVTYNYDASKRVTEVKAIVTADDEPNGSKTYKNNYTYENDRIKTVSHNTTGDTPDVTYTFNYDKLGRKTSVHVGSQVLSTNTYTGDRSGLLQMVEYGNNGKVEYGYDSFDRLETVKYDCENQARYTYAYGSNGRAAEVKDHHLERVVRTEFDLADRPCQVETNDLQENPIYCTKLKYDKYSNLESFAEILSEANHETEYAYDNDNRITSIAYDGSANNIAYEYDELGRIKKRTAAAANHNYVTEYEFVAAPASCGANATTPLVSKITQNSGEGANNTMDFEYAYDNRGNITDVVHTTDRTVQTTHYDYDALGQLVRVDDKTELREGVEPEGNETLPESSTWVYAYDCGGNITSKKKYPYTTEKNPGTANEYVPYLYVDSNWKDKLTAYNGQAITYDSIGNPLFDGVRTYTWGAGRQLKHISMPANRDIEKEKADVQDRIHVASETVLQLVREGNTLEAHVFRSGREITDEREASAFTWSRVSGNEAEDTIWNNAHVEMKQISLTDDEINGNVEFSCTFNETEGIYDVVSLGENWEIIQEFETDERSYEFSLENGVLKVQPKASAINPVDYKLVNGTLFVNSGFSGTLTSSVTFNKDAKTLEIDFSYDHNGLRTQKKVVDNLNNTTTTYDYTLHGKLITHLTKRVVNAEGVETSKEELHFFYDAQSRPAFVEYDGTKYRYIHNLQGDIVAIVDPIGNHVIEYMYDAWGKFVGSAPELGVGALNPFRYRGYVWDEETKLHYLRSRYYSLDLGRFINADGSIGKIAMLSQHNQFVYCGNIPVSLHDEDGNSFLDGLKRTGGQLIYNLKYSPQIKFWSMVCIALYGGGCKHSADLLSYSLQSQPKTRYYSNNSTLANKIKDDSDFRKKMQEIIANGRLGKDESMAFNSDLDLFGALHNVGMIVNPITIDGVDMYHVVMTDTYDFKYEQDYSSQSTSFLKRAMYAGIITGNNLAYADMNLGAINEYDIIIDFYVE